MSMNFYRISQRYNPEDSTADSHQNLKSETGSQTRKEWKKLLNIWQRGRGGNQVNFNKDKGKLEGGRGEQW
jgi:hypothetical protein